MHRGLAALAAQKPAPAARARDCASASTAIVGELREMAGEAGLHEGEARVSSRGRHSGDEPPIAIDIATFHAYGLFEQQRPREPGGLAVEGLTELGRVDALEPDAQCARLALWDQLQRIAIGDEHHASVELRPDARLHRPRRALIANGVPCRARQKQRRDDRMHDTHCRQFTGPLPDAYL